MTEATTTIPALPNLPELVQQSQYRETVMLVVLVIGAVTMLLRVILPYLTRKQNGSQVTPAKTLDHVTYEESEMKKIQAAEVILREDGDGNYIILSVPRLLREVLTELKDLVSQVKVGNQQLTHLANHQSEMMDNARIRMDRIDKKLEGVE